MEHRKFSRGSGSGGGCGSGEEPQQQQQPVATSTNTPTTTTTTQHPLLDPLPDHSWEVSSSASCPPAGLVEGPTISVVRGERVEHYPNQHLAVNLQLHARVADATDVSARAHTANAQWAKERRASLRGQNDELSEALKEYAKGLAVHAASAEAAKPDRAAISAACKLTLQPEDIEAARRPELTQEALRACTAALAGLLRGRDADGEELSKAATQEAVVRCAGCVGDRLAALVLQGTRAAETDVHAYLRGELEETAERGAALGESVALLVARRGAAALLEMAPDELRELDASLLEVLDEATALQHARLTLVNLSQGEVAEFKAELDAWRTDIAEETRAQQKRAERQKAAVQEDVRRLLTGRSVQKAVHADATERFHDRKMKMLGRIRDNARKQDQVFAVLSTELKKLSAMHVEKVQLVEALVRDVEEDAMRAMKFNAWMECNAALKTQYEEVVAQQCQLEATLQRVSHDVVNTLKARVDDLGIEDHEHELKMAEAKPALEMHTTLAAWCGGVLDKATARMKVLHRIAAQLTEANPPAEGSAATQQGEGVAGASSVSAAADGVRAEAAKLQADLDLFAPFASARRELFALTAKMCDEVGLVYEDPYAKAQAVSKAAEARSLAAFERFVQEERARWGVAEAAP